MKRAEWLREHNEEYASVGKRRKHAAKQRLAKNAERTGQTGIRKTRGAFGKNRWKEEH